MDCADCQQFTAERQHRKRIYEYARLKLSSADASFDPERYMSLKALADQARINLERIEAEIARHQDTHARADDDS